MKRAYAHGVPVPPRPIVRRGAARFSFDEAPTLPRGALPALPAAPATALASGVMKVRRSKPPPLPKAHPRPPTLPPAVTRASGPPPLPAIETAMPLQSTRVNVPPPASLASPRARDDRPTLLPTLLPKAPKRRKRRPTAWNVRIALLTLGVAFGIAIAGWPPLRIEVENVLRHIFLALV